MSSYSSKQQEKLPAAVSEKLKIIDQKTHDMFFQTAENMPKKKHVKYKKSPTTFHLGQFIKAKKSQLKKSKRTNYAIYKRKTNTRLKKRCSSRRSKLKKLILKNRLLKKNIATETKTELHTFCEVTETLKNLTLETRKEEEIHSRRFRSYCDNRTSKKLSNFVDSLLRKLDYFQKRAFRNNAYQGKSRRRLVIGFREVQAQIKVKKIKCVIMATDCESCEVEGGLDSLIDNIKTDCHKENIPCVFALQRRELTYALFKKCPISCVGILDYDGAQDIYAEMLSELEVQRENYSRLLEDLLIKTTS